MEKKMPMDIDVELSRVEDALRRLQEKLAALPETNWRASLAWEAVNEALEALGQGLFDAHELPSQPKDFQHWREKYNFKFAI